MGATRRNDGLNPFRGPRDDKRAECESVKRRIRKIRAAGAFTDNLETVLADLQAELVALMAQARAFKVPAPPKKYEALPASWAV